MNDPSPRMPNETYDTIVIGAGGMGSAAICELARRGRRVLGLEQFSIPHELGSSAGSTRIFRFAYFEDPSYVPLMRFSYERWQALERDSGEHLLTITGGLDIGLPSSRVVQGAKRACSEHRLAHEILRPAEIARRFPAWCLPSDFEAVFQPEAGIVLADRAIAAHVALARKYGAVIREREPAQSWTADAGKVAVTTARGTYEAGSLVLAGGAWMGKLVSSLGRLAIPERQVVAWFATDAQRYASDAFPVFILECPDHGIFYGFPDVEDAGAKFGKFHHRRENVDPDGIDRNITPHDIDALMPLGAYLGDAIGAPRSAKTCMFVNSPDEHFIVDVLPAHPHVVVAAGFSGHGFKFCSGIGAILADLATTGSTRHDTRLFELSRAALARAD